MLMLPIENRLNLLAQTEIPTVAITATPSAEIPTINPTPSLSLPTPVATPTLETPSPTTSPSASPSAAVTETPFLLSPTSSASMSGTLIPTIFSPTPTATATTTSESPSATPIAPTQTPENSPTPTIVIRPKASIGPKLPPPLKIDTVLPETLKMVEPPIAYLLKENPKPYYLDQLLSGRSYSVVVSLSFLFIVIGLFFLRIYR